MLFDRFRWPFWVCFRGVFGVCLEMCLEMCLVCLVYFWSVLGGVLEVF